MALPQCVSRASLWKKQSHWQDADVAAGALLVDGDSRVRATPGPGLLTSTLPYQHLRGAGFVEANSTAHSGAAFDSPQPLAHEFGDDGSPLLSDRACGGQIQARPETAIMFVEAC